MSSRFDTTPVRQSSPSRTVTAMAMCLRSIFNRRHFSTSTAFCSFISENIRHQAKNAIADYFHTTHSLAFSHADHIAFNSPSSLSTFLSDIPFSSPSDFPRQLRRSLAYRLINEQDFLFESIGVAPEMGVEYSLRNDFVLSEKSGILEVISKLVVFGFPWRFVGLIFKDESSVFRGTGTDLVNKIRGFEIFGLDKACLVAVCLAFPSVLAESCGDSDLVLRDMQLVFDDFVLRGEMEENVEDCIKICKIVKVFYDLGCSKGQMGGSLKGLWKFFLRIQEEELVEKVDFLCRLGLENDKCLPFILKKPEILELDLNNVEIRMPDYLAGAGFSEDELTLICRNYPHVMGRNKLINMPSTLRALGISNRLMEKIKSGDAHWLSKDYLFKNSIISNEMDADFTDGLQSVVASRREFALPTKIEFLQGIGFGENKITTRALKLLMGTRLHLQQRFDSILKMGIEFSELSKMVSICPKILNQNPDMVHEKVDFLCNKFGLSVKYLCDFPAYLTFNLENRIKPRYRMLYWLKENGLLKKMYSPASVVSTSENKYLGYLKASHPAAPKVWLEVFKFNNHTDNNGMYH